MKARRSDAPEIDSIDILRARRALVLDEASGGDKLRALSDELGVDAGELRALAEASERDYFAKHPERQSWT